MLLLMASLVLATPESPAPAPTSSQLAAAEGQKIKCRKLPVTGSLAGFTRECRTVAEWDRLDEANREAGIKIQDRGQVVSCGSSANGC